MPQRHARCLLRARRPKECASVGNPRPRFVIPAPLSSPDTGDRPVDDAALPAPALEEMKQADKGQVYSMADKPWWGWLEDKQVGRQLGGQGSRVAQKGRGKRRHAGMPKSSSTPPAPAPPALPL